MRVWEIKGWNEGAKLCRKDCKDFMCVFWSKEGWQVLFASVLIETILASITTADDWEEFKE